MVILVTGGAGFIGGNFIHYLLKQYPNIHVVCLDALTYAGNPNTLAGAKSNPNFTFIKGDIADTQTVDAVFRRHRPDIVVNFAAESHVDRSIKHPQLFLHTNVMGTGVLLDTCLKYKVTRFHQISTDEVYGDLPLDRPDLLFYESSPLRPSSPYSASKASADLLVCSYFRTYGLPVTISRCTNNYGPYQHPEKLIPKVIQCALLNQPIPIYGTGQNMRDWVHVQDHCIAIDHILHHGKAGELYHIGGCQELSNLQVVHQILQILNKSEQLITFVADRPGHDLRYALAVSKMHTQLQWSPSIAFSDGIQSTVQWYLEHQEWVNSCF